MIDDALVRWKAWVAEHSEAAGVEAEVCEAIEAVRKRRSFSEWLAVAIEAAAVKETAAQEALHKLEVGSLEAAAARRQLTIERTRAQVLAEVAERLG